MNAPPVKVRIYTYKSFRHYGGREIITTPHICNAILITAQSDHTFYVELLENCGGYEKGHRIAVQPKDFDL